MIAPANYYEACEDMKACIMKKRKYLGEISKEIPSKLGWGIKLMPQWI